MDQREGSVMVTSEHGAITIMLAEGAHASWREWIGRASACEGFVNAQLSGGFWLVCVRPSTPAAEVLRAYFNDRLEIKEPKAWPWC